MSILLMLQLLSPRRVLGAGSGRQWVARLAEPAGACRPPPAEAATCVRLTTHAAVETKEEWGVVTAPAQTVPTLTGKPDVVLLRGARKAAAQRTMPLGRGGTAGCIGYLLLPTQWQP